MNSNELTPKLSNDELAGIAALLLPPTSDNLSHEPSIDVLDDKVDMEESRADNPEVPLDARSSRRNSFVKWVVAVCVAAPAAKYGVDNFDPTILKGLDIAQTGRTFIDASETASPFILGASGLGVVTMLRSKPGRKILKMSKEGLSTPHCSGAMRRAMTGMLLPALGIGALGTAFMIEDGVEGGPQTNISSMSESIEQNYPGMNISWGLEPGTGHFMNNSRIEPSTVVDLNNALSKKGGAAVPFDFDLAEIPTNYNDHQAGALFSVDGRTPAISAVPEVAPDAKCDTDQDGECDKLGPNDLVVDSGEGFEMGDVVTIKGRDYEIVGFTKEDQSLLNRLVGFSGTDSEKRPEDYYGVLTVVENESDLETVINDLGLQDELDFQTTSEFIKSNKDFWNHNGTPLLVLLIADIAVFAAASFSAVKRFEQERNRSVLAGLEAIGTSKRQIAQMLFARIAIQTSKGVAPGTAGAAGTTWGINNMLPGFKGCLSPAMMASATGMVLVVQAATTANQLRKDRQVSLVERMKSK